MKKYLIILLFIGTIIAWCATDKGQTMNFKQASSIFSHTIKNIQETTNMLWLDGFKSDNIDLEIFWENLDFKLQTNIISSGNNNYLEHKRDLKTSIDLHFLDKIEQSEYQVSWNISNIIIEDNIYTLLNNSKTNLWTWNYQWDLVTLIADNLKGKRIKTTFPYKWIKTTTQDIKYILERLSAWEIFNLVETINYEWKLAYRIELIPSILQDINSNTDMQIISFQWLLIVRSASKVELKIETLEISNTKNTNWLIIKWSVLPQEGVLSFQSHDNLEKIMQISWEKNRKNICLFIDNLLNTQEILWLDLKLYPKSISDQTSIQINGILNISPLMIYWSDLEKDIKIDINGYYDFKDIQNPQIKKPDSYILWEQILWDRFSLETIMSK